jgi:hypothetical protein
VPVVCMSGEFDIADGERRASLFAGDFVVSSPRPPTTKFAAAARSVIEQLLGDRPELAQQRMTATEFSALFQAADRNFSHNEKTLEAVSDLVRQFGCDLETTFMSHPALYAFAGQEFLPYGLGTPLYPHRDTWFGAPACQVTWWCPLDSYETSARVAFHPSYWDSAISNSSSDFDFDQWRQTAEQRVQGDVEALVAQPRPTEPLDLAPEIRIGCPAGGIVMSSVAQLYSIVPNEALRTYFCARFDTVTERDLLSGLGPRNVDAEPRGSSLSSFVRCSDLSPIPAELVAHAFTTRQTTF